LKTVFNASFHLGGSRKFSLGNLASKSKRQSTYWIFMFHWNRSKGNTHKTCISFMMYKFKTQSWKERIWNWGTETYKFQEWKLVSRSLFLITKNKKNLNIIRHYLLLPPFLQSST
jgi:hypothetical protein